METTVVWYIRMSLTYFFVAALLGLTMIIHPESIFYYRNVHVHFNLLGWMSMMIYGVGYHVLPKFSGKLIYSPALMKIQFWFANLGLIGMAVGWTMIGRDIAAETANGLLLVSAITVLTGIGMFAFNIGMTVAPIKRPAG